jgi:hypothetical protein
MESYCSKIDCHEVSLFLDEDGVNQVGVSRIVRVKWLG